MRLYIPLAESWFLYDNSDTGPRLVAGQAPQESVVIVDTAIWAEIKRFAV